MLFAQSHPLAEIGGAKVVVERGKYRVVELAAGAYPDVRTLIDKNGSLLDGNDAGIVARGGAEMRGGRRFQRFDQVRGGHLVLGGEVTVVSDRNGSPLRMAGTLAPSTQFIAPAAAPPLIDGVLTGNALAAATRHYAHANQWTATVRERVWTAANPWATAPQPYFLTAVVDVTEPAGHRAHRFYLDVTTGKTVLEHALHCDINRELFRRNTNPINRVWTDGDAFPGALDAEEQDMVLSTAETYNLFHRTFGRLGYNGSDGLMRLIADRTNSCPNASAGGNTISHCNGVVSDDIVAHEWTHNYIGARSGLIYAFESGALNEALADIFGESVDLLNSRGDDAGDDILRNNCNSSLRWQLGEDATAFGVLRDLWNPECRNDPEDRSSSRFRCVDGSVDNGGVHTNSGVVNRSFTLLVDGGTLNGTTVTAIGLTKALHIYYHAMHNYATRVTDFNAFAAMLEQSANDLVGLPLNSLTVVNMPATVATDVITAADVAQVTNAVTATEMNQLSNCGFSPTLDQNPPAICSGDEPFVTATLLDEDWENGLPATWSLSNTPVNPATFDNPDWALETTLPDNRAGQGVFAANLAIGDCRGDQENGTVELTSPAFTLPANEPVFTLSFDHYYSTENDYDGGVVYLSRNGGPFTIIPNSAFLYNGYDAALEPAPGNDNPLAGQRAFHGADQNSTTGSWGTSLVDLAAAGAVGGDQIRLRWALGMDGCNGWLGWYLDDVRVVSCNSRSLPVVYSSLTATAVKREIHVDWATELEENNEGFFVERATAASPAWRELGFVAAGERYHFADGAVEPGVEYQYRLRQRDFDGTEAYSAIVTARVGLGTEVLVYPNPTGGEVTVVVPSGKGELEVVDFTGRRVLAQPVTGNRQSISLNGLPAGVYIISIGEQQRRIVLR